MKTTQANLSKLSKAMQVAENDVSRSYIDVPFPSESQLDLALESFDIGEIIKIANGKSRKLCVVSDGDSEISVSIGDAGKQVLPNKSTSEIFYLSFVQARSKVYLLVSTTFRLYDFINKEPYRQQIGEFNFQKSLSESLGLNRALAYKNVPGDGQLSLENLDDYEFLYHEDGDFSYILFSL